MRSDAPDRPGIDASQNNWSLLNLKPTPGSFATTTDQTIHTAKDSSRQGTEITGFAAQSSGRLSAKTRRPPAANRQGRGLAQACLPAPGHESAASRAAPRQRAQRHAGSQRRAFHRADGEMHPDKRCRNNREQQPEAALPYAGQIIQRAE